MKTFLDHIFSPDSVCFVGTAFAADIHTAFPHFWNWVKRVVNEGTRHATDLYATDTLAQAWHPPDLGATDPEAGFVGAGVAMSALMQEMGDRALRLGVPLSVQLDLTYRCNEKCVHCYLDHDDHGEMTTAEIKHLLEEMAEAGVFVLTLSGGEIFLRKDFFEIVERARQLLFSVKVKTNGVMIREKEAARLRQLGIEQIQISVYSHRPEVHDAITKLPGSLKRTIRAIRFLKSQGLKVTIANVLMAGNFSDQPGVVALAKELGVFYTLDPTITPKMDGDTSILALRIPGSDLKQVFHNEELVGNVEEFCAPPPAPGEDVMEGFPCSAGHTACYISPYGDVFPCVQFPLPS